MASRITRRHLLKGVAGAALAANLPMPAIAQNKPVKIGLLTVKTGPLAQGGIQMEQGTNLFLKDRNTTLAGRKVELVVGDTGGNPAGTKTKAQELIERDGVDMIFGPLAAFELLAITDYVAAQKVPILSIAGRLAGKEALILARPPLTDRGRGACGARFWMIELLTP